MCDLLKVCLLMGILVVSGCGIPPPEKPAVTITVKDPILLICEGFSPNIVIQWRSDVFLPDKNATLYSTYPTLGRTSKRLATVSARPLYLAIRRYDIEMSIDRKTLEVEYCALEAATDECARYDRRKGQCSIVDDESERLRIITDLESTMRRQKAEDERKRQRELEGRRI